MKPHTYQGMRCKDGRTVVMRMAGMVFKQMEELTPRASQALREHDPCFDWGHPGSGAAQLALALLLDNQMMPFSEMVYQDFKSGVVALMPVDGWELRVEEIEFWFSNRESARSYFQAKWDGRGEGRSMKEEG